MKNKQNLKPPYLLTIEEIYASQNTDRNGISTNEAINRLDKYGPNHLDQSKRENWFVTYLRQYKDLMIALLLVSSFISFFLGDERTSYVLLALVFFNTIIGFTQEYKAEKIMESLVKLVIPEAAVVRNGVVEKVASNEIVPGDIVYIEEGNSVPADLRIVEEIELSTNDFALTGESNPSRKFTHAIRGIVPIGNRHNLTYMGTTVATGHGYGVVVGTGMQTELGRIANLSESTEQEISPLQKEINTIARYVTFGTVILCTILLPIAIQAGLNIKDAFLFAIGIASSIIPQGLPAEINTTLAQAANKLAKARALVKKLSAVESLGATSIICTDKTGTLTKNQMTVEQLYIGQKTLFVSGTGYQANGKITDNYHNYLSSQELKNLELFFATGLFASNARVNPPDSEHKEWYAIGDPTEAALITLAAKANLKPLELDRKYPELKEFAFDSARKIMSSVRVWGEERETYVFAKGAPEKILEKCTHYWDGYSIRRINKHDKQFILDLNEKLAQDALRNLSFAYKVLKKNKHVHSISMEEAESNLVYLGMVAMIDPLREEVPQAMLDARNANISVSIITGDYATTAKAIAHKAGLSENKEDIKVVIGDEINNLSDQEIKELTEKGSVLFSRVSPEDKLRIVNVIKKNGRVVAVTGDGINDAPALKTADIGVAMGVTGTDVAKQSADIVLLDDSFHTLIGAVQQGRIVFQNIKKGTLSCFTSNSAELIVNLLSLAFASLFGVPLALTVMQILAIDLVAELFPIAALGWDKADKDLMHDKPRNPKKHILNRSSITDLIWCGLLIGGLAFANFMLFFNRSGVEASTVLSGAKLHMQASSITYLTIVLCQLINIIQRRSSQGIFTSYQLHNKQLWTALLISLLSVMVIIYTPINSYFGSAPINLIDWGYAIGAAAIFLGFREIQRLVLQRKISY